MMERLDEYIKRQAKYMDDINHRNLLYMQAMGICYVPNLEVYKKYPKTPLEFKGPKYKKVPKEKHSER